MQSPRRDFRFLFVSLVALCLVGPLLGPLLDRSAGLEVTFTAVIISVVARATRTRRQRIFSLALGVLTLAVMAAARFATTPFLLAGEALLVAGFLGFTGYLVLTAVLGNQRITTQEVYGALSVYLLLGMTWQFFFVLCLQADPGAIRLPAAETTGVAPWTGDQRLAPTLTYFSFVTLTTLGYGDIVPVSRMARTLAWMEAVCGQLFLAVLVARLVGMLGSGGQREDA